MIQVYVQELTTYNNAIGVGRWIDVDNFDAELKDLLNEATNVLKEEGYYYGVECEEWEIVDYECEVDIDLKNIYQDIDTLKELNDLLLELNDTEIKVVGFLLDEEFSLDQIDKDKIEEVRVFESWDDAIDEFIEFYLCIDDGSSIHSYLDYSKIQRDLEIEGYCENNNGEIFYYH